METTRLYAPLVDALGRAYPAPRAERVKLISRTVRRGQLCPKAFTQRRFVQRTRGAYFPVHGGQEGKSNIRVTGHAVVAGSQGLGNGCQLKDAVRLRSVHDPVKDVTSGMGRVDNRLGETEDVNDVNHLGCAGNIRAVKEEELTSKIRGVPVEFLQWSRKSGNSSKTSLSVRIFFFGWEEDVMGIMPGTHEQLRRRSE